jgi:hypothetical protein
MRFFVVFSVDCAAGNDIDRWNPDSETTQWECTEDDESEYDCFSDNEGEEDRPRGQHRKYLGDLSRQEFDAFVNRMGLFAESIETLGTLSPYGVVMPAISFDSDKMNVVLNAYVTPYPSLMSGWWNADRQQNAWRRIKRAMVSVYGR